MNITAVTALELSVSLHKRVTSGVTNETRAAVIGTADKFYEWLEKHEGEQEGPRPATD